jgi:hypothetical protein
MKFDSDWRTIGSRLVILDQSFANFSRLYANYRVISGCISCWTLIEVHSYRTFLESLMVPVQAVVDHVRQKLLAALARLKNGTVQDRIQFTKDRVSFNFVEGADFAITLFAPNLMGRQIHGTHRL